MKKKRVSILDVGISVLNYDTALTTISNWINTSTAAVAGARYVCVSAVHLVMECQQDTNLRIGVNNADLVTPDGMPLVWLSRWFGATATQRVYGPTLTDKLCQTATQKKWRIFLLGGKKGQGKTLTTLLQQKYPGLKIVGTEDTPIRPLPTTQNKKVIARINQLKPDIVFVGFGCPYQEQWMIDHHKNIKAKVLIGVGAAFNFISGEVKQAPAVMQKAGLEWLFRFWQEPRRLWYRYTVLNAQFIALVIKQLLSDQWRSSKIDSK